MIAHEYETTFILRPELDEAESNRLLERLKALITDAAGTILIYEDWGKRKLAYPIQKHQFGHYVHINARLHPAHPSEGAYLLDKKPTQGTCALDLGESR